MLQIPLGYRRQNRMREIRTNIHILLCRHSDELFRLAYSVKVHVQNFFSILCSQNCGIVYPRFHARVLSSSMVFCVVEKTSMLNSFCFSCGTLSDRRSVFGMDWLRWEGDQWVLCRLHVLFKCNVRVSV